MAAAIDDSCTRPGSVPFKWEICPGTPKHVRSSSASAPSSFPSPSAKAAAVTPKLTPPPSMAPSPYHSPRASSYAYSSARSASVSPSRRRPTAFHDVAPRPAVAVYRAGRHLNGDDEETAAAYRCFPLPVFRRRDGKRGGGGGHSGRRSGTSGSSFRSDRAAPVPSGLLRSASTASSSCLSLSSGSSNKFAEPREVEAASGWF